MISMNEQLSVGKHFVYVFNTEDRAVMLKAGFRLVRDDGAQNIYVFENSHAVNPKDLGVNYVMSDVLSF